MGFSGGGFRGGSGGFRGRRSFGPREMHDIKCSACGKDAQVPFKPRGDSPVYCRDCFMKQKGITPRGPMSKGPKEKSEASSDEESLEASAGEASEDEFEEDVEEN